MFLSFQWQIFRVLRRTPPFGLSIRLVEAKQRCSEGGTSRRLIVKHSSIPSRRLAAASGCSRSNHWASFSSFAIPALASSFQAARISERVLILLVLRQTLHHVAQLVIATTLHQSLGAKDRIDRRPQGLRSVDHEQPPSPGT